ncbi:uncharacterized protein LODBEIA_P24830 [Lodderomyces beijingensis]|uniref:Uncharacterized protein n=1 Tax=Lodderomyces beijingensis TaxID=1775926 RepID=A0ABP0ZJD8_9ASCO
MAVETDRKSRLAALRKNRSKSQSASSNNEATKDAETTLESKDSLVKAGDFKADDATETSRPPLASQVIGDSNSDQPLNDDDGTKDKVPGTKPESVPSKKSNQAQEHRTDSPISEMMEDIKPYIHKAKLRTDRAINKIIQDRIVQESS